MEDFLRLIKNPLIVALLLLTGASGSVIHAIIDPPRTDPYTGTQGEALERRVTVAEAKIEAIPDNYPPDWLTNWVARVEQKADACEKLILQEKTSK